MAVHSLSPQTAPRRPGVLDRVRVHELPRDAERALAAPYRDDEDDELDLADHLRLYQRDIGRYALLSCDEERDLLETIHDPMRGATRQERDAAVERLICANLRLPLRMALLYQEHGCGMALLDVVQFGNMGLMRAIEKYKISLPWRLSTYACWWIRQSINRGLADQARLIRIPVHVERCAGVVRHFLQEHPQASLEEVQAGVAGATEVPLSLDIVAALVAVLPPPTSLEQHVRMPSVSGRIPDEALLFGATLAETAPERDDPAEWVTRDAAVAHEQVAALLFPRDAERYAGTPVVRRDHKTGQRVVCTWQPLTPTELRALILRYGLDQDEALGHDGRTLIEVGALMGISREWVRVHCEDALQKLRELDALREQTERANEKRRA